MPQGYRHLSCRSFQVKGRLWNEHFSLDIGGVVFEGLSLVVILKDRGNKYVQNNGTENEGSKTKHNNY